MSPTVEPCANAAAATNASASGARLSAAARRAKRLFMTGPSVVELQLRRVRALRIGVEVPVVVVVQVVDPDGGAPVPVEAVDDADVDGRVLADALVGEAVDVGVVERPVLSAAQACPDARAPALVEAIARKRSRAPARNVRLPLADGVARHRDEAR